LGRPKAHTRGDRRVTARRRADLRGALRDAWRRLRGGELRPERAAGSVGVGLLVGLLPTYGIQTLFCLLFTVPLRLDFPLAWVASNIANPLTVLFIIALDIEVGGFLLRGVWPTLSKDDIDIKHLGAFLADAMVGGIAVGSAVGLIGGLMTLALMRRAARARQRRAHSITRTPST
jgi:uncharacterized protein (DUF2062 family)